jgi:hypothetical protein
MNNTNQISKIKVQENRSRENCILEIGNVTELTLGDGHYYHERIRYYDSGCTIQKK